MWSARQILMEDQRKETSLLVERDDRGEYWRYPLYKVTGPHKITPRDVRLKQTGDNRLIGFMDCLDETMFAMARINHVPPKNRLAEEAARLGYRGRRGKSYLYQGHEWVPIPEDDEKNYWHYPKENKEQNEILNEVQTSDEEESEETNEKKSTNEKENPDNSKKIFSEKNVDPSCIKIEPELWNDPKPDPTKIKNKMLSIEDLSEIDANETIDINNASFNKSDNSTNIIRDNILETDAKHEEMQRAEDIKEKDPQKIKVEENKIDGKKLTDKQSEYIKANENIKEDKKLKDKQSEDDKPINKQTKENESEKVFAELKNVEKAKLDKELDSKKEEETKEPESKIENKKGVDKQIIENKEEDTKAKEIKIDDKKTADNELKAKKGKDKKAPKKGEKAKNPKDKKQKQKAKEEGCEICYDSSTSMYSTPEPYTPTAVMLTKKGAERERDTAGVGDRETISCKRIIQRAPQRINKPPQTGPYTIGLMPSQGCGNLVCIKEQIQDSLRYSGLDLEQAMERDGF
ncbi:unnamed protein product [Spodoptera exigua]|nr:unnamed protein product [Spodoptera exigua]